jgi:hypothetical protein
MKTSDAITAALDAPRYLLRPAQLGSRVRFQRSALVNSEMRYSLANIYCIALFILLYKPFQLFVNKY